MPYKVLDHPADYEILVTGRDLTELFSSAMAGMTAFLKKELPTSNLQFKTMNINSNNVTYLLVDFLSEALRLAQTNKEVYSKVVFKQLTETSLQAELFGSKIDRFDDDIKAVTYHGADVRQKDGGAWETKVLFDI